MASQERDDKPHTFIRGESGTVKRHDLPLPWPIEDRLTKGQVHEVSDPADWVRYARAQDSALTEEAAVARPAVNASKADWVRYARAQDSALTEEAANALTKPELQKY